MSFLPYSVQKAVFSIVEAIPFLAKRVNRWAINRVVNRARPRPHPLSTERDYVWWGGLTDRRWSGRHLPPRPRANAADPEDLATLFRRKDGKQRMCPKSTCLFPAFAQYLTDGFIRTESEDLVPAGEDPTHRLKRNTSNHEIDLCPLYGRTRAQTLALRLRSDEKGRKGRLASQMIDGEEYAPFLYKDGKVDPQFDVLDPPLGQSTLDDTRRPTIFAFGGDRANSVPQVAMLNTLFLREHNRLAAEIEADHPDWDDDRVFETARNAVIVIFIKIVVEDYINHISPLPFSLRADPSVAWNAPWNKPNWITTEFSLLYRWHALIPDALKWGGEKRPVHTTFMNNALLIDHGLLAAFSGISDTQAAELGPCNTAEPLLHIEVASIKQDRDCALASFSDYCDYMSQRRPANFEAISSDPEVAGLLRQFYDGPRDVDFHVGLFCEDRVPNSPLPSLVLKFVALDAFSQALTNPLLSRHVFKRSTFSGAGWRAINRTETLRDVVDRNVTGGAGDTFIGMTRPAWTPE
ncbi:peroxidase family protein [uncultured Tateyamaria sp.]|uniref:peroxidase family protein n=1 Tax=uncultured Tateyamaria sp. TaxID=455651 RepID=UPI0026100861|nr:peroxidase family protein [uncultured Tateyamaria sp.]